MTEVKSSAPAPAESASPSRLLLWSIAAGVCIPVAMIALAASPLGEDFFTVVVGMPALMILWAIAGLGALIVSVRSAMRKQWSQCVIASILPIAVLAVALDPVRFVRYCNHVGDLGHFIIMKPRYDKAIAALPADRRPHLAVFNWGGMSWASRGVVYDESDEVALPRGRQSAAWLAEAGKSELSCTGYGVEALWDHYYLASFPC